MTRHCDCPHTYPVCACFEGLSGEALLRRSNFLSSLAGWPAPLDPAEVARIVAEYGRPAPPAAATPVPVPVPVTLALLARMKSCPHWQAASDCGCGHNRCAAGKGHQGVVSHRDCFRCLDPDVD